MWSSSATAKHQRTNQVTADHQKRSRGGKALQGMRANTPNTTQKQRDVRGKKFGGFELMRDEADDYDDSAAGSTARAVSPAARRQVTADPSTAAASALKPTDGQYVELRRKQAAMMEQHAAQARVLKMVAFSLNYM